MCRRQRRGARRLTDVHYIIEFLDFLHELQVLPEGCNASSCGVPSKVDRAWALRDEYLSGVSSGGVESLWGLSEGCSRERAAPSRPCSRPYKPLDRFQTDFIGFATKNMLEDELWSAVLTTMVEENRSSAPLTTVWLGARFCVRLARNKVNGLL